MSQQIKYPKPILKWVGGKTQLLDKLIPLFPTEMNNYREIFLGGGSVLLAVLTQINLGKIKVNGKIYAYDLNEPLVYTYKNIQTQHEDVFMHLQTLINEYNACGTGLIIKSPINKEDAQLHKENYYYWVRTNYNKLSKEEKQTTFGSAMFIFLNKTCFRGLFRVGPNGFNVPFGHYENPKVVNKPHLDEIHRLIQNVVFECADFQQSLAGVSPDDFVYLDPPYAQECETGKSFVGYTLNGFNLETHKLLFKHIHELNSVNIKFILSNADVGLVREAFEQEKYSVCSLMCKRSINAKKPDAKAKEVIVCNY